VDFVLQQKNANPESGISSIFGPGIEEKNGNSLCSKNPQSKKQSVRQSWNQQKKNCATKNSRNAAPWVKTPVKRNNKKQDSLLREVSWQQEEKKPLIKTKKKTIVYCARKTSYTQRGNQKGFKKH